MQVRAVNIQVVGNILDGDGVAVIAFDKVQRLFRIVRFLLIIGNAFIGEFLCQKEKVFIHNAVHPQITVPGQLARLKHLLMAEPQCFILPIMQRQILRKACPFQIALYLNPLHANPGISPGILVVCFIINQFPRADQEGVSLPQPEDLSPRFVYSCPAQHIMD